MRLDNFLVQEGYAENIKIAQSLILSGSVLINGVPETRMGVSVPNSVTIRIRPVIKPYVSRGAYKLLGAFEAFPEVQVSHAICLDLGASTGGFTQVLLEKGAKLVFAIDVGKGQLAQKIRRDPRVCVFEGCHIQEIGWEILEDSLKEKLQIRPQEIQNVFVVGDLSFISIERVYPILQRLHESKPWIFLHGFLLVKPQFEVEDPKVLQKGILKDPWIRWKVLRRVLKKFISTTSGKVVGLAPSPIPGTKGNQEYFFYFQFLPKEKFNSM